MGRNQKGVGGTHAIVMASPDGVIRHWDAGAEQLFGYSAEEALAQSLDLIVPAGFRERHWAGFRNAVTTGSCKFDRAATNIPVHCKDGTIQAFPGRFVFLQGARNEVIGVAALFSQRAGSEAPFGPILPL
jgi:PAS domain S-box-containing protein